MHPTLGFLIDLDGTMYRGTRPIPEAESFIDLLNQKNVPYLYLTNNSSRNEKEVCEHLHRVGIKAMPEQVVTTSQVTAKYVWDNSKNKKVYCIGGYGLQQALLAAGLELTEEEQPDFVVQGVDMDFHYEKLTKAIRFILNGAAFVCTNPDRLLPSEDGFLPGSGAICASIQAAVQMSPVIIGKPSSIMMDYAIRKIGLPKQDVWMTGDNIDTDIAGGKTVHCRTALVLTGVATKENIKAWQARSGIYADVVADDLKHLATLLHLV